MTTRNIVIFAAGILALPLWRSSAAGPSISETTLYLRSLGKLCGWAECQGWCEYHDSASPLGEIEERDCSPASTYNRAVTDGYSCTGSVCVTSVDTGRPLCRPDADTQTACYSLYRNSTSNMIQTRVCWDGPSKCMDLVNFCNRQNRNECSSYSQPSTIPPVVSGTVYRVSQRASPNVFTMSMTENPGSLSPNSSIPTAGTIKNKRSAFGVGVAIGICAAAGPILIVVIILLIKRRKSKKKIKIGNRTNESVQMNDVPVYASIGPKLPPLRGPTLQHTNGEISSSAKSLYISGRRPTQLLGNLQRNKSLPALVLESGSVPMETNDMLRSVSMANRLSSSTDDISPTNRIMNISELSSQLMRSYRNDPNKSRKISPRYSGQGVTNQMYSKAIISGPPSVYLEEETDEYQRVDSELLGRRQGPEHHTDRPQKTRPSLEDLANLGGSTTREYVSLEQDTSKAAPLYSPTFQSRIGYAADDGKYASLHTNTPNGVASNPVYMGLATDGQYHPLERPNRIASEITSPLPTGEYMGLGNDTTTKYNQYMGIGDGVLGSPDRPETEAGKVNATITVGKGAYTELNLLDTGMNRPPEYMGLSSEQERISEKETNIPSTSSNSRGKQWKSKSTLQKRNAPPDQNTITTGGSKMKPKKKSFLFRSRRKNVSSRRAANEVEGSDMCLDYHTPFPPPAKVKKTPHYFTLDLENPNPTIAEIPTKNGHSDWANDMSEYQEPGLMVEPHSTSEEPYRSRSRSQPIRDT